MYETFVNFEKNALTQSLLLEQVPIEPHDVLNAQSLTSIYVVDRLVKVNFSVVNHSILAHQGNLFFNEVNFGGLFGLNPVDFMNDPGLVLASEGEMLMFFRTFQKLHLQDV